MRQGVGTSRRVRRWACPSGRPAPRRRRVRRATLIRARQSHPARDRHPARPRHLVRGAFVLLLLALLGPGGAGAQEPDDPAAGIRPGGGGAFVKSNGLELRLLGYVQPLLRAFPDDLRRPDAPASFSVRRARVDVMALLGDDHTLFIELDGAPAARTALVEAWANWALAGDALQVRAGKFIGHFSAENLRSSRSLLTAERYMALNSMFFLPGLDTQTGSWSTGADWPVDGSVTRSASTMGTARPRPTSRKTTGSRRSRCA